MGRSQADVLFDFDIGDLSWTFTSGLQVTNLAMPLVATAVTSFAPGAWFMRANRVWITMLRAEDPRLAYDPVRDPVSSVAGSRFRVSMWLTRLRSTDARPDIECWRVRTINRFAVWVCLTMAAQFASETHGHVCGKLRASVRESL